MRLVLQRVSTASVTVDGREVARIGRGFLVLVGVVPSDGPDEAVAAAAKLASLRILSDADGKMNHDLLQAGGAALVVSQFTLAGSLRKGRRPSFDGAAPPEQARPLVARLAQELRERGVATQEGVFGADMKVALTNDGPVTFVLDVPVAD